MAIHKFDYSKGLLMQLYNSKLTLEQYIHFVCESKHSVDPNRDIILFDTPFLEFFSKTPWYAIPLAWTPWVCYYLYQSETSFLFSLLLLFLGVFVWSFLEYLIHRFIFHGEETWLPDNKVLFIIHFLAHGIHHAFPMDRYRLVFPVALGYVVVNLLFVPFFRAILPALLFPATVTGGILGYVAYDLIHYFIHHSSPKDGYFKNVKLYHMQHHYKNYGAGYGVSSKFWDLVFKTELKA